MEEMEENDHYCNNGLSHQDSSDLDLSFTSSTSITTTTSARSSLARSSLCLSFTDSTRISSSTSSTEIRNLHPRPHRKSHNPNWTAITAATNLSSSGNLHLHHLKLIRHVGSGNLGRVFLTRLRDYDHANFALKVVDNNLLTSKKLLQVQTEARILSSLDHPFLPTLYAHLQASHYTCFLIDFCPNGDLHSLLRKQPSFRFPIDAVRFFAAEVLVALEYLHSIGIVYRDLKPENILIRQDGHIMLSDFDLSFNSVVVPKLDNLNIQSIQSAHRNRKFCKFYRRRRTEDEKLTTEFVAEPTAAFSRSCVGTHEYLSPELISGDGHGNGVDWWAFGVLIYELLHGTTPFRGGSKESTLRNIATRKVMFNEENDNTRGMAQVKDLIEKLLAKDPGERLGCARGATDVKRHPFFSGIKWPLIRMYRPPEVRGLAVKRSGKVHGGHVGGWPLAPTKRRSLWKGLKCIFLKSKGPKR